MEFPIKQECQNLNFVIAQARHMKLSGQKNATEKFFDKIWGYHHSRYIRSLETPKKCCCLHRHLVLLS